MPQVSIIIPVYNRTQQLREAVDSVLAQTSQDFELLVIDDGSTVDIKNWLRADSKIKYFQRPRNKGVSAARNFGIKQAQGTYICFLDSDDTWLPKKLQKQIQDMLQNPDLFISQTDDIWIRNGQRVNPQKKHQKIAGDIFEQSLQLCLISPSAVIIKRELFDKVGLFDETLPACEDYDLWLRVTKDYPVGLLNEKLIVRQAGHADQLSAKYPSMDRFRVKALLKILKQNLTDQQKAAVKKVLEKKLTILQQGAFKRGKLLSGLWYWSLKLLHIPFIGINAGVLNRKA